MITSILMVLAGLFLLYKGADWLVEGSSTLAKRFGISPLVIGLTVVAFGTSMPELIVNVFAAIQSNAEISYGNIIGSNIFNILLILGITATIAPLAVNRTTVWKEIPFALLAAVTLLVMSNKLILSGSPNVLTRADGIILLFFFAIFVYYIFGMMKDGIREEKDEKAGKSGIKMYLMIAGGLVLLFLGGRFTVNGAVSIAMSAGISQLLISSTIIAAGTSLPELITSIMAALKKEMDISVGNIVGSNIMNIFFILGVSTVISPIIVPVGINIDLFILLGASLLLFIFSRTNHKLERWEAIVFLLLYMGYTAFLIFRG